MQFTSNYLYQLKKRREEKNGIERKIQCEKPHERDAFETVKFVKCN